MQELISTLEQALAAREATAEANDYNKGGTEMLRWVQTGRCDAAIHEAPLLAAAVVYAPGRYGRLTARIQTGATYAIALPHGSPLRAAVRGALAALRCALRNLREFATIAVRVAAAYAGPTPSPLLVLGNEKAPFKWAPQNGEKGRIHVIHQVDNRGCFGAGRRFRCPAGCLGTNPGAGDRTGRGLEKYHRLGGQARQAAREEEGGGRSSAARANGKEGGEEGDQEERE